MSITALNGLD